MVAHNFKIPPKAPTRKPCAPSLTNINSREPLKFLVFILFIMGFGSGVVLGLMIGIEASRNNEIHAKCRSVGGQYGGSKCFLNGVEVK